MSGKLNLTESEMNKPSEIESKFKIYKKPPNDPSYGDVTLMQHPTTRERIAMKERTVNTEDQFVRAILNARARKKLKNEYLLNMKDYSTRKKKDFCSTFYVLRTYYEYESNHLKKEIMDRKNKGDSFSMEELTHLLYNTVEAGSYLQEFGQVHGDIRPSQILVTKKGTFKLGDRLNDPTPPPRNQFNNIVAGKDLYMSPILYSALKKHNFKISHNAFKSDVFSLGMSVLEAGLMRPMGSVYDEKSTELNYGALEANLEEFSNKYQDNPLLVTTISKMLEVNETKRPDFINIKVAIPSYNEILEYFERGEDEDYYEEDFTNPHHGDMQPSYNAPPAPQQQDFGNYGAPQMPPHGYDQYGNPAPAPPGYGGYGHPPNPQNPQYPPQKNPKNFNNYPPMNNPPLQQQPPHHQNQRVPPQQPPQYNQNMKQGMPPQQPQNYQQGGPNSQNAPPQNYGGYPAQPQYDQYGNPLKQPQQPQYPQKSPPPQPQNNSPQGSAQNPIPYNLPENVGGNQTKIIDGKAYKEMKVECTEVNDQGQKVRRIYIRYVPVDEADKMQANSHNNSSANYNQPPSQGNQNSYFAKNRGNPQPMIGNYHGHGGYGKGGYPGN